MFVGLWGNSLGGAGGSGKCGGKYTKLLRRCSANLVTGNGTKSMCHDLGSLFGTE